jgi:hypothetical protein
VDGPRSPATRNTADEPRYQSNIMNLRQKYPPKSKLHTQRPLPLDNSAALKGSISHVHGAILSQDQKRKVLSQLQNTTFLSQVQLEGYGYNPYLRQTVASFVEELVKDGIVKECREPVKEKPKGKFICYELNIDED